jgi:hypothetical protein
MKNKIVFHRPKFEGNKIRFTWESRELDDLFRNGLNFIELTYFESLNFDLRLAYNQMMCLLFPIVDKSLDGNTDVHFEDVLYKSDVTQWINLRNIDSIYVRTELIENTRKMKTPPSKSNYVEDTGGISLLYGGGKDSLAALSLFSRLNPKEEIHILRVHWSRQSPKKHREIFSTEVVQPLSKLINLNYVECSSTLHQNLKKRETAHSVGIHFYHGCLLQLYHKYQFRIVNYSYDALEYFTFPKTGYPSIRPEKARQTTELFQKLSINCNVRNISFGIPSFLHYDVIKTDPRNLISLMYMCEDTKQKWCYNCRKCFTFGLLGLENGFDSDSIGFDYEKLFLENGYFTQKISSLLELNPLTKNGPHESLNNSMPYNPILAYKAQFSSFRHSLNKLNPSQLVLAGVISEDIGLQLQKLSNSYSNDVIETRQVWVKAMQLEADGDASEILHLLQSLNIPFNYEDSISIVNDRLYKYNFSRISDI